MPGLDPNEALRLVNEYRSSKGLFLCRWKAMRRQLPKLSPRTWPTTTTSLTSAERSRFQKRLAMTGYRFKVAAENVGVGQKSFAEIVEGWKQSPPHSRNMLLAEAKHMGIAYEYKPDTKYKTYWTLVVAAP